MNILPSRNVLYASIILLVAVLLVWSSNAYPGNKITCEDFTIPSSAENFVCETDKINPVIELKYFVNATYPAENFTADQKKLLRKTGWSKSDYLGGGERSNQWSDFYNSKWKFVVRKMSFWRKGDWLLHCVYEYKHDTPPKTKPNLENLSELVVYYQVLNVGSDLDVKFLDAIKEKVKKHAGDAHITQAGNMVSAFYFSQERQKAIKKYYENLLLAEGFVEMETKFEGEDSKKQDSKLSGVSVRIKWAKEKNIFGLLVHCENNDRNSPDSCLDSDSINKMIFIELGTNYRTHDNGRDDPS